MLLFLILNIERNLLPEGKNLLIFFYLEEEGAGDSPVSLVKFKRIAQA